MSVKRAACYIRVSTDEQAEYSPDSQLREMRSFAAQNKLKILDEYIFIDEGISGRKADTRPAFQAMIAAAKQKPCGFDVLLLYKFSRFARNREDSVVYKSLLRKKCGVEVISMTEPLDSDNKMSIIMEAFIEAMDEYYSINLSEDVRRTMTEKALRGELQSAPPFGYAAKDNVLVQVPSEAEAVKAIFQRFMEGESFFSIARWLNDAGIRTHRGCRFENRTVAYILQNPVYTGKLRWTPTGKIHREFHHPDTLITDGRHEAIIAPEVFEEAQRRVEKISRQAGKSRKPETSCKDWLSGLLRCPDCGKSIVKSGRYWRCGGYAHGTCRKSQSIPDDELKKALTDRLILDSKSDCKIHFSAKSTQDRRMQELRICQNRLKKIPGQLNRIKEAYLAGVDTLEEYQTGKRKLMEESELLQKKIAELESAARPSPAAKVPDALYDPLTDPDAELAEQYKAARAVISGGTVNRDKNVISINYYITV